MRIYGGHAAGQTSAGVGLGFFCSFFGIFLEMFVATKRRKLGTTRLQVNQLRIDDNVKDFQFSVIS